VPAVAGSRSRQVLRSATPAFIPPQLATLVAQAPVGPGWVHELKWDGYRIQIRIEAGEARVHTRRGHDWTAKLPRLAAAAAALPVRSVILDAEMVVLDAQGRSSFSALRSALGRGIDAGIIAFVFDLLWLDGVDLRERPLLERKAELVALLSASADPLRYCEHFAGEGSRVYASACDLGAEGIISKRHDAPYRSERSDTWRKVKCINRQEFVIAGYVPALNIGTGLRGLVLAVHEGGKLAYAGRVGTGWGAREAGELLRALKPLERERSPLDMVPRELRRGVTSVEPELVADVQYLHWKERSHLRHASYQGLREDRDPGSVVAELAA
jgi:bifunctional non-homologous end joining protein LigD